CFASMDVDCFDAARAARLVSSGERVRRLGDAIRTIGVGQVERTNGWRGQGAKSISEWLSIETDCAHYEAQSVVVLAGQLQHLPVTQAALRNGTLSGTQAVEVARGAIVAPNAEAQLLNLSKHVTVRDLRDATSRVVAAATDEAERHRQVHKSRYLKSWIDLDGSFNLKARMTVANGALVMAALKPIQDEIFKSARKSGAHERPEAYGADALMALCEKANHAASAPAAGASRTKTTRSNAVMHIRVDIDALKRGHTEHGEICEIAGVGPIPVATATEYLGEAFLKLLVVDGVDIKTVAHMGRAIPATLRTAVEERDRVCQVPKCDMSVGLEIDHIKPFAEGGPASFENLVRLCKRHHLQKTHDGYRLVERHPEPTVSEQQVESVSRWEWRMPECARPPDVRDTG
ncbi:MAG: HNH endonuclease signature motif containing protein, partial [Actinomycetes bacterium]